MRDPDIDLEETDSTTKRFQEWTKEGSPVGGCSRKEDEKLGSNSFSND